MPITLSSPLRPKPVKGALLALTLLVCPLLGSVETINDNFKAMTLTDAGIAALDFASEIYTSSDGGVTFVPRADPRDAGFYNDPTADFTRIDAVGTTVLTVGVDGLIMRSLNSGINWSTIAAPTVLGSLRALEGRPDGPNPNRWLVAGDDGTTASVYRSIDDGTNWTSVASISGFLPEAAVWSDDRWVLAGSDDIGFDGLAYHSTDGINWTASSVPTGINPLLDLAADGNGTIIAVGENGQIIRSIDNGQNFVEIGSSYKGGAGDLNTVAVNSAGTFFVGGDEKLVLEIDGASVSTNSPTIPVASSILDLLILGGEPVAVGGFFAAVRTVPLELAIASGGSLDFVLTASDSINGRSYYVETTTDLVGGNWDLVPGTERSGDGNALSFDLSRDGPLRFWRVVEF